MPLLGNERLDGREVVETRQHLAVRAVGTAVAPLHALRDDGPVGVAVLAAPPDDLVAAGRDVLRRQRCVLLAVPLHREHWELLCQAVLLR